MPLLRNPDRTKLSKRKNPTSILYYRERGYLAEALMNFLGILIDSRNDDPQLIGSPLLEKITEHFELENIALGGPVFDIPKLTWLNGQWIRHRDVASFMELLADFGFVWPAGFRAVAARAYRVDCHVTHRDAERTLVRRSISS